MSEKQKPKLYVKAGCPWCDEVLVFLNRWKIQYELIHARNGTPEMQEMIRISGQGKVPTLDLGDGRILADFGVSELIPFLTEHKILTES